MVKRGGQKYVEFWSNSQTRGGLEEVAVLFLLLAQKKKYQKEKCTTNAAQRSPLAPVQPACRPPHFPRFAPLRSWTSARFIPWKNCPNLSYWNRRDVQIHAW